jgi:hypothetical protein
MSDLQEIVSNEVYDKLARYIQETKYGSVTIIIQDGKIIQIEKNEKVRFK